MPTQLIPLELSPDYRLTLTVYSGDGNRFANLFQKTWDKLPAAVRKSIVEHWSRESYGQILLEYSNGWRKSTGRFAQVGLLGYAMKFSASDVDEMPELAAQWLIAHEVAHVFQRSSNKKGTYNELEDDADRLARDWGFDDEALSAWKIDLGTR